MKSKVLLSKYIIHRSLEVTEDNIMSEKLFLSDILYLSIFLESFVLYDELCVVDIPEIKYPSELMDKIFSQKKIDSKDLEYQLEEKLLLKNRFNTNPTFYALGNYNTPVKIIEPEVNQYHENNYKVFEKLEQFYGETAANSYVAFDVDQIKFALSNDYSLILDYTSYMQKAIRYVDLTNKNRTSQLIKHYNIFSDSFQKELTTRLVQEGSNKPIFIPPITSVILNRAKKKENILKIALELREEFSKLRKAFREYEAKIVDDSLSIQESLNASYELENIIKQLFPKPDSPFVNKLTEWRDISDLVRLIDGASATDFSSFGKLFLGNPIKEIIRRIKRRKVKYLFKLRDDFIQIKNYGNLVQKIFNKEITEAHKKIAMDNGFKNALMKTL